MASPLLPPGAKAPRRGPPGTPPTAGREPEVSGPPAVTSGPLPAPGAGGARDWSRRAAVGGAPREGAGRPAGSEVQAARPVLCGRAEVLERAAGHGGVTVTPLRHRELPGEVAVRVGEAGSSPFSPPQPRLVPVADASGRAGSQRAPRWLCRAGIVCSHVSPAPRGKHCPAPPLLAS